MESETDFDRVVECASCSNSARLVEWVFIEETFDGTVMGCPSCGEHVVMEL